MTVVNYYGHPSFCCASLYALQILRFSQIEGKTPSSAKRLQLTEDSNDG